MMIMWKTNRGHHCLPFRPTYFVRILDVTKRGILRFRNNILILWTSFKFFFHLL